MPLTQMHEFGEDDKAAAAGYAMLPNIQETETQEPELQATVESNIAPLWLVFSESIINTQNITSIERFNNNIFIYLRDKRHIFITPSDIERVWASLQKVFAEGAS